MGSKVGEVTHSDIAQALQSALLAAQGQDESNEVDYSLGITLVELAEFLDITEYATRKTLRMAIKAKVIEPNGRQKRRNMLGEWNRVPVYRVKTE